MRRAGIFLAVSLVLATSGCAQRVQVDIPAEEAAIRNAADVEQLNAAKARDVEGLLTFHTDDASMLPPNAPIATGKEAIRELWTDIIASPSVGWQTSAVEVSSAGDLAYSRGTYELAVTDPEGNPATEIGKWVDVWKKQPDGTWKLVVVIWNPDQPAPAPVAE
jgi:ketosteroid isomerase-like protein